MKFSLKHLLSLGFGAVLILSFLTVRVFHQGHTQGSGHTSLPLKPRMNGPSRLEARPHQTHTEQHFREPPRTPVTQVSPGTGPDHTSPEASVPHTSSKSSADKIDALEVSSLSPTHASKEHRFAVHVAFSTDCKPFQNWQSQVVFESAAMVNHRGPVTRIASGCTESEQQTLKEWVKTWDFARVHFTPHFSKDEKTGKEYKFYNKPRGMLHWLTHGEVEADVIALIDPDQFFLTPFSIEFSGNMHLLTTAPVKPDTMPPRVSEGFPAGQFYGLGDKWRSFNLDHICGKNSSCHKVDSKSAWKSYTVGPPYVSHIHDWVRIAQKWVEFVPKVYDEYPHLLAEMYAYCMAAASLDLPHTRVDHWMVSNVDSYGEGWPHVDALGDACNSSTLSWQSGSKDTKLPSFLHACQSYRMGPYRFGKRSVPTDIFDQCNGNYLKAPLKGETIDKGTEAIAAAAALKKGRKTPQERDALKVKRSAFMTCQASRIVNEAIRRHKTRNSCLS